MGQFEVVRNTTIAASRERVHDLLTDFREWRTWSPWEEIDPDLQRDHSGAETGVGAKYAWSGNRKAGVGSMEIIGDTPERVDIRLSFEKPWTATNQVTFDLTPSPDGGTAVSWRMTGEHSGGISGLFMRVLGMDRLVGKDFEKGLAQLKAVAETPPGGG